MDLQSPTRTAHLRHLSYLAAERFLVSLTRAELETCLYNPDQPRVPAGQPGGGQWGDGSGNEQNDKVLEIDLIGNFTRDQRGMTGQAFMSKYCSGRIRSVFPSEFADVKIGEIEALAKSGDARARTCIKLFSRPAYRK